MAFIKSELPFVGFTALTFKEKYSFFQSPDFSVSLNQQCVKPVDLGSISCISSFYFNNSGQSGDFFSQESSLPDKESILFDNFGA